MQSAFKPSRGEVYYADLSPVKGAEQGGYRPVLIVQNNTGNAYAPTLIVVPLTTSHTKHTIPTHVPVKQGSMALCEQLRTIDKSRIKDTQLFFKFTREEMREVDKALKISLALK